MSERNCAMIDHQRRATLFNQDEARTGWHDGALWFVREKRDRAAAMVPEWEELRDAASKIKQHSLSNLSQYLEQFEQVPLTKCLVH